MNPFERAARADKASKLLTAIDASGILPTADEVRAWPEASWVILAEIAGVPEPSPLTVDVVVRMLKNREELLRPFRVIGKRSKSSQVVELRGVSLVTRKPKRPDPFDRAAHARARREACKPGRVFA